MPTNHEKPPPHGPFRLLDRQEILQASDERLHYADGKEWRPVWKFNIGRTAHESGYAIVKRPLTLAQQHGEELLAALKESHSLWENLLYQLEEMGVAEAALNVKGTAINMETFAAMLGNTKAAIAKAEGK